MAGRLASRLRFNCVDHIPAPALVRERETASTRAAVAVIAKDGDGVAGRVPSGDLSVVIKHVAQFAVPRRTGWDVLEGEDCVAPTVAADTSGHADQSGGMSPASMLNSADPTTLNDTRSAMSAKARRRPTSSDTITST